MNKTILFCTIIALTGCKSLDYVKSGNPVMEGNSLKNIDELSGCISRQWAGNGTPITSIPIENGVSLLVPQAMGGYDVVLDIKKAGNGSSFTLYERVPALTPKIFADSVNACK
ncbi:TPA: hypothetical protein P6383_004711 [Escherichia coli]|nr:hypothetical protein [Escherichia coli]